MQPNSSHLPKPSLTTFTDLYQLTMAQAYWRSGHTATATFSMTFRGYPKDRGYYVAAGLQDVLTYLEGLQFTQDDIGLLDGLGMFDKAFLGFLSQVRFEGDVRALAEGTICAHDAPVIEVTAPIIQGQFAETYILNQINLQTMLATKASRCVFAARDKYVVDFGARRIHGTDAANKFARVSYIAGFAGTSNVQAGLTYGIPLYGTMAHSFVTSFEQEVDSFRAYAKTFPNGTTLLVDTYSTEQGVRNAIKVGLEMAQRGYTLRAVRLDSGDLLELSRLARRVLDEAGLRTVQVFASGGLDEFSLEGLVSAGAPIDGFGVGTKVGVSADAPWTDCAYKLVEYDSRPVLKLSPGKATLPGPKQVYRRQAEDGMLLGDTITDASSSPAPDARPLLELVMKDGKRLRPDPSLNEVRESFRREFAALPEPHKALRSPTPYPSQISPDLELITEEASAEARLREGL